MSEYQIVSINDAGVSINDAGVSDAVIHDTPKWYTIDYGPLPEHLRNISLPIEAYRKEVCIWLIDGQRCRKECAPFIFYCQEHKNIPDIKRYEPITICRKRK